MCSQVKRMSRAVLRRLAVRRAAARTRVIRRRQRQRNCWSKWLVKGAEQVQGRQRVARQAREAQQGHEVLGVGRALATCRSRSQAPQANPKRCHVKCMYVIMFCGALSAGMRRQKTRKPVSREFRGRITMVVALTET